MEHTGHSIPQHRFSTLEMFLQDFLEAYSFHQRWLIIPQIEFNPKDVEQHSEINSNCDRDYYQVIFFTEFFKFKLLFDSSWIFAQVIGIIWSNWKINGIESKAINLPTRACLFFTQKAGDDEEDANYFDNQGRTLFLPLFHFFLNFSTFVFLY